MSIPDPSERVSVWGAFGWAEEYLPDEMAPPVARDLIARLVRGELDGDQEAGVRENIALFRPWRRAYATVLGEGMIAHGSRTPTMGEAVVGIRETGHTETATPLSGDRPWGHAEGTLVLSLSAASGERRTLAEFGDDRMRVGVAKTRGGALGLEIAMSAGQPSDQRLVRVVLAGHDDGPLAELVVGLEADGHGEISLSRYDHTLELAAERPGACWHVTATLMHVEELRPEDQTVLEQSLAATENPGCGVPLRAALARLSAHPRPPAS